MCCWEKSTLRTLGWVFTTVFCLGAVALIILAGINFRAASQT